MEYEMIAVGIMNADYAAYQRKPDSNRVKRISREWDEILANPVLISKRKDGTDWAMDGNHTRLAAMDKFGPDHKLPCVIYEGLSIQEEADIFTKKNSLQKKPRYNEMLKAKLAAKDKIAVSYFEALDEAGLKYSLSKNDGSYRAHASLMSVFRSSDKALFVRAVKAGVAAAADRDDFYQAGIFPGFCSLIIKHPEVDDVRLIYVAQHTPVGKVVDISNTFKRGNVSGGGQGNTNYFRRAFIELYNAKLRKNRIVEN